MFVNEEVVALQQLLLQSLSLLRPGGRLLLLSFHSIEDSIIASAFARHKVRPAAAAAAAAATEAAAATATAIARAAGPLIEDGFRLSRSMVGRALEASHQGANWRPLFKVGYCCGAAAAAAAAAVPTGAVAPISAAPIENAVIAAADILASSPAAALNIAAAVSAGTTAAAASSLGYTAANAAAVLSLLCLILLLNLPVFLSSCTS
ncbi:hypothetical protein Emag_006656 [Eimeria magna]